MPVSADGRGREKERKKKTVKNVASSDLFLLWLDIMYSHRALGQRESVGNNIVERKKGRCGTIYKRGLSDRLTKLSLDRNF
jgi:hypothetical protein